MAVAGVRFPSCLVAHMSAKESRNLRFNACSLIWRISIKTVGCRFAADGVYEVEERGRLDESIPQISSYLKFGNHCVLTGRSVSSTREVKWTQESLLNMVLLLCYHAF